MQSELSDPDQMVPVVKIEPKGMGNPMIFRPDKQWNAFIEELKVCIDNYENGQEITLTIDRMTVGDWCSLPEHTGW